jgi:diguanylate cyclase (GGDEF)-like protein
MLTLAVIDLDAFKEVNDRTGHAGGDRLLVETAHAWRAGLRADDVLARVGGDEFVVLMPATTPDEARVMLARLRLAGSAAWSAGLARWRPDEPLEACLERADGRLYEAKARRAARAA